MEVSIPNFSCRHELTVTVTQASSPIAGSTPTPATVTIYQRGGSMSFQHDLLPDQARKMAMALLDAADHAQGIPPGLEVEELGDIPWPMPPSEVAA